MSIENFKNKLNSKTFAIYATKAWKERNKPTVHELNSDLRIFSYIGKSLKRYYTGKTINIQIMVNQIIRLNNIFGIEPSARLLFFYFEERYHPAIKTFLTFLNTCVDDIPEADVFMVDLDEELYTKLEEL